jgi:hypothetical protein
MTGTPPRAAEPEDLEEPLPKQDKLVQLNLASSAGRRAADGRVQGWRLSSCSRRMPGELVTEKRQGGHAKRVGAGESGWLVLAMRRWA